MSFVEFNNLNDRQKYKAVFLGGDNYDEEDFKLLHLSNNNSFFSSLKGLENVTHL